MLFAIFICLRYGCKMLCYYKSFTSRQGFRSSTTHAHTHTHRGERRVLISTILLVCKISLPTFDARSPPTYSA